MQNFKNFIRSSAAVRLPLAACAVATAFSVGACGSSDGKSSNMSEEEAQQNWAAVSRSLSDDNGQALSIDVSIDTELDCRRNGEMSIDSDFGAAAEDGDLTVAFDLGIDYDDCRFDNDTIDGSLEYSATFVSERTEDGRVSQMTYTYNGLVKVTDEDGVERDCFIDAQGVAQSEIAREPGQEFRAGVDIRYTGTICGHDAETIASASVVVSD